MRRLQGRGSSRHQSDGRGRELGVLTAGLTLAVGGVLAANLTFDPGPDQATSATSTISHFQSQPTVLFDVPSEGEGGSPGIGQEIDPQSVEPDYSSPAALAVSISWPLYEDGSKPDPRSYTKIRRDDADTAAVLPSYQAARAMAVEQQQWSGNAKGLLTTDEFLGRCSAFVATVVVDTVTPEFPQTTLRMFPWVSDPENGWTKVGDTEHYDPDSYEPGDVFLTRGEGHTFMWIGDYGKHPDVIADAALGNAEGNGTRTGALRRSPIDPETGTDKKGRPYDVWRYETPG